jgi:NosR/NirI family transcriptional regulator, nitrous oxide reductase regulator
MSCASPSQNRPANPEGKRRWQRAAMGTFRLGVLFAAFACLHALPEKTRAPDRERILAESRMQMPAVVSLGDAGDDMLSLLDQHGEILGWATTTYPEAEKIEGYSGPSELLVIFDTARKVKAVSLLHSADTAGHVAKVLEDRDFWKQWDGRPEAGLGAAPSTRIVTGASLTSEAMARGIAARFGAAGMEQWFPDELTTAQVKRWFPDITRIEPLAASGTYQIWGNDKKLGTVLRSSRMGVSARGFNGTSDVIVCLDPAGTTILGVSLLGSRDNQPYVGDVADELKFADGFAGQKITDLSESDPPLVVSGASVTADAVFTSVREMLRRHQSVQAAAGFPWKSTIALSWIALGLIVGLAKWGNRPRVRFAFAILSVVAGITLGWMVSQDQLIGWSRNGLNARALLPLLVLTAVALVVPAYTGKNIYCNRICPHGAAQTLLGQLVKKRFALPPKLHHLMRRVPWITLLVIWVIAFSPLVFPFSHIEPFETWSSGFQALLPAVIFSAGLLAAVFLPQGYCHYGCPTGALLKFLTSSPGRWTGKDTAALVLVAIAGGFVMFR